MNSPNVRKDNGALGNEVSVEDGVLRCGMRYACVNVSFSTFSLRH